MTGLIIGPSAFMLGRFGAFPSGQAKRLAQGEAIRNSSATDNLPVGAGRLRNNQSLPDDDGHQENLESGSSGNAQIRTAQSSSNEHVNDHAVVDSDSQARFASSELTAEFSLMLPMVLDVWFGSKQGGHSVADHTLQYLTSRKMVYHGSSMGFSRAVFNAQLGPDLPNSEAKTLSHIQMDRGKIPSYKTVPYIKRLRELSNHSGDPLLLPWLN